MFAHALLGLAVALPLANALGCYGGLIDSLRFKDLHGLDSNINYAEARGDIERFCSKVKGSAISKGGAPVTDCSEWDVTHQGSNSDACAACRFFRDDCEEECAVDPYNKIDWAINLREGGEFADGETREVTYDACRDALNIELDGCMYGSEQNHGSFWYRIDPNFGSC